MSDGVRSEDVPDDVPEDVATGLELSLQELIYAGLDVLRASRPGIDLVAYLHDAGDNGPQLFLASPSLASLKPNDAFDLFSALRDALELPGARGNVGGAVEVGDEAEVLAELGGFHAVTLVTTGTASRGLHAVGRRDEPLTAQDQAAIGALARVLGTVNHRLEAATRNLRRTCGQ